MKFQLRGVCPTPLAYAYAPTEENKKRVRKFSARFLAFSNEISTVQKIVLSSSRGQGYFRGLEASRPRPRTSKCVLEAKDVLEDSTSGTDLLLNKKCNYFFARERLPKFGNYIAVTHFWSPKVSCTHYYGYL